MKTRFLSPILRRPFLAAAATLFFFAAVPTQAQHLDLETLTNGVDVDLPPGPSIAVGDLVSWSYVATNNGEVLLDIAVIDDQGVTVSCPTTSLASGESMICTASGIASAGQYANVGMVTAVDSVGGPVSDSDPSHYFGEATSGGSFSIRLKLRNPPIMVPEEGGSFEFRVKLKNETAGTLDQDAWSVVTFPDGTEEINGMPLHFELAPGAKKNKRYLVEIEGDAMPGVYTITGYVGTHPDEVTASSSVTFEKLASPLAAGRQYARRTAPGGIVLVPSAEGWVDGDLDDWEASAGAPAQSALGLPEAFALYAAYPNPFNPAATLRFDLPEAAAAKLVVYDAVGREVTALVDGRLEAGRHEVTFDGSALPSGVYFVRFTAGQSFTQTQRMTLLK